MQFIDAVYAKGENKILSCAIETTNDTVNFSPMDLTPYAVKFRVLGSPTSDAKVLIEHIITQVSDLETIGQITNATRGEFCFAISAEDTVNLGCGAFPISIQIVSADDTDVIIYTLTEGSSGGEFSKIRIVEV